MGKLLRALPVTLQKSRHVIKDKWVGREGEEDAGGLCSQAHMAVPSQRPQMGLTMMETLPPRQFLVILAISLVAPVSVFKPLICFLKRLIMSCVG